MYFSTQYASPVGTLTLCAREDSLVGLWLEGQRYFGASLPERARPEDGLPLFAQVKDWLDRYFAGERPEASELPLSPMGTPFRQEVWKLLQKIPYGQVITYGQLSRQTAGALGRPSMSARAVGNAAGHNPISILIPCHRLVGADGSLTGYAGGVDKKRWLLTHEGACLSRLQRPVQDGERGGQAFGVR